MNLWWNDEILYFFIEILTEKYFQLLFTNHTQAEAVEEHSVKHLLKRPFVYEWGNEITFSLCSWLCLLNVTLKCIMGPLIKKNIYYMRLLQFNKEMLWPMRFSLVEEININFIGLFVLSFQNCYVVVYITFSLLLISLSFSFSISFFFCFMHYHQTV